jgi:hypothetical protein
MRELLSVSTRLVLGLRVSQREYLHHLAKMLTSSRYSKHHNNYKALFAVLLEQKDDALQQR